MFKIPADQSDLYNAFRRTDLLKKKIFLFEQMRKIEALRSSHDFSKFLELVLVGLAHFSSGHKTCYQLIWFSKGSSINLCLMLKASYH